MDEEACLSLAVEQPNFAGDFPTTITNDVDLRFGASVSQLLQDVAEPVSSRQVISTLSGYWFDRPEGCFFDQQREVVLYNHADQSLLNGATGSSPTVSSMNGAYSAICKPHVVTFQDPPPSYNFQEIPPQSVRHGNSLRFSLNPPFDN